MAASTTNELADKIANQFLSSPSPNAAAGEQHGEAGSNTVMEPNSATSFKVTSGRSGSHNDGGY